MGVSSIIDTTQVLTPGNLIHVMRRRLVPIESDGQKKM